MADNTEAQYSHLNLILENHSEVISNENFQKQSIDSIIEWINEQNVDKSSEEAIGKFVLDLQDKISQLSYIDARGNVIIPYMGSENGVGAWQYSAAISNSNEGLTYITDIEIGKVLNDLWKVVEEKFDEEITDKI